MTARACLLFFFALLTPSQRQLNVESFDHVWTTIRDQHWDPKLGGLDWQAVRGELRPRVEQADTMDKARGAINDMIGRLHQSHFAIIPAELYQSIDPKTGREAGDGWIGFDLRVLDGKATVISVEPGSPAHAAGIRPGWQILKIGDADMAPVIEKVGEAYKDSTLRDIMLARSVGAKLAGKAGEKARLELLDGHGKTAELEVARTTPKGVRYRFGFLPPIYVWFEARKLDSNIGYAAFNAFLDPTNVIKAFEDAILSCLRCDGFIVDLRGNPGGIGAMGSGMAGWFIDKSGQMLGTMYTREAPLKFVVFPRGEIYRGRLAILLDGASGSTSEVFAGGLKDLGRARIFGTRTAGAALPSVLDKLPNGDGFQHAIANYISEGGKPLEGVGVVPDVEVKLSREVLLQGRDPVVEAAVEWLRKTKETK